MILALISLSVAEETDFRKVKVADAKGKQADANLIFSDNSKKVIVRVADRDFVIIPYDQLDKVSYEYTKKHRITAGALVMLASLGAGAVVMLDIVQEPRAATWITTNKIFRKVVVLRMDKKEYKDIIAAFTSHTGKDVDYLGKADKKQHKEHTQGNQTSAVAQTTN